MVHSEADGEAKYVRLADESVCIGPAVSSASYSTSRRLSPRPRSPMPGDSSGLRIPVRERGFCRKGRALRVRVHRPASRHHPADGGQDQRQGGDAQGGRTLRPGLRGCVARGSEGDRQGRALDWLSGDHQGGRRRRRTGNARRAHRSCARVGGVAHALRGAGGVQQSPGVHGEVPRESQARRDPGAGRRAQERRLPVRARLLDAAPAPEDHRGSAGTGHPAARHRARRRALCGRLQEDRLPRRGHVRVPVPGRRVFSSR